MKSKSLARSFQFPVALEAVERRIYLIRGSKVMLDRDLAELYNVRPIALRQQVKRNRTRFPDDFMFRLSHAEAEALVSQNVIPSRRSLGGHLPYAFTEQGVAMLSSVLRSERAAQVNIAIMRAFVRLRGIVAAHRGLAQKLDALEKKYLEHDVQIKAVFDAIRRLIEAPVTSPRHRIGFVKEAAGAGEAKLK